MKQQTFKPDKTVFLTVCCIYTLFLPIALYGSNIIRGNVLASDVYNRPDGNDVVIKGRMILEKKGRASRTSHTYSYSRDRKDGSVETLVRFVKPTNIKDLGLLGIDDPSNESRQWLYLPELGRVRRISSKRKGGKFVGSDIYYEDMQDRIVSKDTHEIIGEGKHNGLACTLLKSTPQKKDNSTYSERRSCIHEETLIPLTIDYYRKGKYIKRLEVVEMEKIQNYWTVMEQVIMDVKTGHTTRIIVDAILYDQQLPDELFTHQSLEDPKIELKFRP